MSVVSASELVQLLFEEIAKIRPPGPVVQMQMPRGAKVRRQSGEGKVFFTIEYNLTVSVMSAHISEVETKYFTPFESAAQWGGTETTQVSVRFGTITGTKYTRYRTFLDVRFKDINYFLTVPAAPSTYF